MSANTNNYVYVIIFMHINTESNPEDNNNPEIVGVYTEEKEALKIYETYKRGESFFDLPSYPCLHIEKMIINKHNPSSWYDSDWEKGEEDDNQLYQQYINKLLELKYNIENENFDKSKWDEFEKYSKILRSLVNQLDFKLHNDDADYVKLKDFATHRLRIKF